MFDGAFLTTHFRSEFRMDEIPAIATKVIIPIVVRLQAARARQALRGGAGAGRVGPAGTVKGLNPGKVSGAGSPRGHEPRHHARVGTKSAADNAYGNRQPLVPTDTRYSCSKRASSPLPRFHSSAEPVERLLELAARARPCARWPGP